MSTRPGPGTTCSWLLLIGANILWAGSYVASKVVLRELSVTMMLSLRFGLSGLLVLPWLVLRRKDLCLTRQDLVPLGVMVLVGFGLSKFLQFGGLALTTASDVALLVSSEALFTAVFSWLLLKERITGRAMVALLLGFFGVYLIVEQGLLPRLSTGGGIGHVAGDLLVILGVASEAVATVCGKTLLTNKRPPVLMTATALVAVALLWVPIGAGEVIGAGWHPLSLAASFWLGWLVVVATVMCYFAWFRGLSRIDGSKASVTLFLQPLLGPVFAVVLLHEQLTAITVGGGLLILAGVSLILREVAPASIALPLPEQKEQMLQLRVALIRDLRRRVPLPPAKEDLDYPRRWDADLDWKECMWWEEGWQATPSPAPPTVPKLIPIVSTAETIDAAGLAETYARRWPLQENIIRDFLLPLGLDTNHGYSKRLVENSEAAKKRAALEKRLANVQRWAEGARKRSRNASKLYAKRCQLTKERAKELYCILNDHLIELEQQGMEDWRVRKTIKEEKAVADAEIEEYQQRQWKAYETSNQEHRKCERYCQEQRRLLRALEDLKA